MEQLFAALGEKPFRARQVLKWIHRRGAADFAAMTDIARDLRAKLARGARIEPPAVVGDNSSADGTRKWLRKAVRLEPGGLHARLRVLLDRQAGLQPQPVHGGDSRPALAGEPGPRRA